MFKPKDKQTPVVLDFVKDFELLGNTESENCRNQTAVENCTKQNFAGAEFSGTHCTVCEIERLCSSFWVSCLAS
jgi:hypothetical protein